MFNVFHKRFKAIKANNYIQIESSTETNLDCFNVDTIIRAYNKCIPTEYTLDSTNEPSYLKPKKYSVMQSDGNRFYGDVVLDSFNMVYSVEGRI